MLNNTILKNCFSYKTITALFLLSAFCFIKPEKANAANPEWMYLLNNSGINAMADAGDYIWLGIEDRNVCKFDKASKKFVDSVKTGKLIGMRDIKFDKKGNMWIARDVISKYDGDTLITYYDDSITGIRGRCTNIAVDGKDNIWFGTSEGIGRYDGTQWNFYNYENTVIPKLIDGGAPIRFSIDKNDNMWAMCPFGFIIKFDGNEWKIIDSTNLGLPVKTFQNLKFDKKGNLWLSTYYEGLAKYDGEHWTVFDTANSKLTGNNIGKIAIDSADNIWTTSYNVHSDLASLIKYDGENWTVYNKENSDIHGVHIGEVAIDKYDNKWLPVGNDFDYGLNIFREGGVMLTSVDEEQNISDNLFIYPNPANEKINFKNNEFLGCNYKIYDILGQQIQTGLINESLTINGLKTGMYFLEIIKANISSKYRFIKN